MVQLFKKFSIHSWSNLWRSRHSFVILPFFSDSEPFCQICSCGFLPTLIVWLPGTKFVFFFPFLFKLCFPVLSTQPLPRATSFPKLLSLKSPSPCASYLCEFQLASFFHSIFPAYKIVPLNLIVIGPCVFSASHQIFAGSERVSRWCPWGSQQCLGLQF